MVCSGYQLVMPNCISAPVSFACVSPIQSQLQRYLHILPLSVSLSYAPSSSALALHSRSLFLVFAFVMPSRVQFAFTFQTPSFQFCSCLPSIPSSIQLCFAISWSNSARCEWSNQFLWFESSSPWKCVVSLLACASAVARKFFVTFGFAFASHRIWLRHCFIVAFSVAVVARRGSILALLDFNARSNSVLHPSLSPPSVPCPFALSVFSSPSRRLPCFSLGHCAPESSSITSGSNSSCVRKLWRPTIQIQ